ncbi:MAG: glycosyltransferase [Parachlamydiales bacterium]|jgi:glycosyltransferase involved in cell wall biosynthesis
MKSKPTLIVAIPAWNEEKNIVKLIDSILLQKRDEFVLKSIDIYSDGSSDSTVMLIKQNFRDLVKVFDFKKNLGKNKRVNQIFQSSLCDILIQIDADITLSQNTIFNNLVDSMVKEKADIVCAYHLPAPPKSIIGKLSYFGFKVWDRSRNSLGEKAIRYYCEGGMRAFSKRFTHVFRLPESGHVGEDSYSFYFAVKNGFKTVINKKACVFIDLPENYSDYVKQMKRFLLDPGMVERTFPIEITSKYETMTMSIKLKSLLTEFFLSPLIGLGYIILQASTKLQFLFYKPGSNWKPIDRK